MGAAFRYDLATSARIAWMVRIAPHQKIQQPARPARYMLFANGPTKLPCCALDEAIIPAVNNATGYFVISAQDNSVSPMWTEPYWSNEVGIKM
jgi:hypothetical protein